MTSPRFFRHGDIDSTNEQAFRELSAGRAQHFDAHIAESQTTGRGRLGRPWISAPGQGMYLSIVLLGSDAWSLPTPVVLSMTVGLALKTACERAGIRRGVLALDWPNDLVVVRASSTGEDAPQRKDALPSADDLVVEAPKLAGILVESRNFDPDAPAFVVGIGANVRQTKFPAELLAERPVSSLALLGCDCSPFALAEFVVAELAELLEVGATAPSQICADYLAATGTVGQRVRVDLGSQGQVEGRTSFLEPDGLRLQTAEDGTVNLALEHIQGLSRI